MSEKLAVDGGTPVRRKKWPQWPVHDDREVDGLRAVVETGNWGGFPSPNVEAAKFAQAFATYHGAKYGNCTASGTTALEVALKAAGVEFIEEPNQPGAEGPQIATFKDPEGNLIQLLQF